MQQEVCAPSGSYHFDFLQGEFQRRRQKNSRYSLRAFARQIGMHPSTLSSVLSGKRLLSVKDAYNISERLELNPIAKKDFFSSLFEEKKKFPKEAVREIFARDDALDEVAAFDIISEWEHLVVVLLAQTDDFQMDLNWIANRIGISRDRAEVVVKRLFDSGLMQFNETGKVVVTNRLISTSDDCDSKALKTYYRELTLAAHTAVDLPVELRDFTASLFTIDAAMLPKLKKEIRRFHDRIEKLSAKHAKKEVYEMLIAAIPRSK